MWCVRCSREAADRSRVSKRSDVFYVVQSSKMKQIIGMPQTVGLSNVSIH